MKILLFAGTSEGREVANHLSSRGIPFTVSVVNEYAREYLPSGVDVLVGQRDYQGIVELISKGEYTLVVDVTHPYADVVTQNLRMACSTLSVEYVRVLRESQPIGSSCVQFKDVPSCVEYLKGTTGNILLTTGVKNLKDFTAIPNYQDRVFARLLNTPKSIGEGKALGYRNIILNDGVCSLDTNVSHIEQSRAVYLVTKESGSQGGFSEKVQACTKMGITPIVVSRPLAEDGLTVEEFKTYIDSIKRVCVVGIGMGSIAELSQKAIEQILSSQVLVGERRMVETFPDTPSFVSHSVSDIANYIGSCEYTRVCVLVSGDTGFYSLTSKLLPLLKPYNVTVTSGVSSVSYLSSRIGVPWNGSRVLSVHGRDCNYISAVDRNARVFLLTGRNIHKVCEDLLYYHLEDVNITIGENLSQEDERLYHGKPIDFLEQNFSSLSTMYIENPHAKDSLRVGIPDSEYTRGRVPMTKAEVRAVSISKCRLDTTSICWDVGAGTGSVSIELALQCVDGKVYAIEKNPEAVQLIRENARRFRTANVEVLEGNAKDTIGYLPSPDVVFIGGSGGELVHILDVAFEKNPNVRVVVNSITLETLSHTLDYIKAKGLSNYDITQVGISRVQSVAKYSMLKAENPVYIISFGGGVYG